VEPAHTKSTINNINIGFHRATPPVEYAAIPVVLARDNGDARLLDSVVGPHTKRKRLAEAFGSGN
jgi:hypothetical protein